MNDLYFFSGVDGDNPVAGVVESVTVQMGEIMVQKRAILYDGKYIMDNDILGDGLFAIWHYETPFVSLEKLPISPDELTIEWLNENYPDLMVFFANRANCTV